MYRPDFRARCVRIRSQMDSLQVSRWEELLIVCALVSTPIQSFINKKAIARLT